MICLDFGWENIHSIQCGINKSVCKFDVKMNNSNALNFRFGKIFTLHSLIDVNIAVFVAYQLLQPVCFGFDHSLKITFRLSVLTSAGMKATTLFLNILFIYESRKILYTFSIFLYRTISKLNIVRLQLVSRFGSTAVYCVTDWSS